MPMVHGHQEAWSECSYLPFSASERRNTAVANPIPQQKHLTGSGRCYYARLSVELKIDTLPLGAAPDA